MMAGLTEDCVKQYLLKLKPKAFAALLSSTLASFAGEEPGRTFALTLIQSDNSKAAHFLVGGPSKDEFPDDAPICQYGTCRKCGVRVASWAKRVICPSCGGSVYCT